ncbi:hypothetical protein [uncultured Castellaniella sp.]|uniref:hypothetical protein n=1 Tax=uncultured Castellaniella sp. TaxID=647907 RepID=UPI002628FFA9|nr:hypothetical protein [uncultured Castellaniella sp.]
MLEVIDGFTVDRSWVEMEKGKFYPSIDARLTREDGSILIGFRHIHSMGAFSTRGTAAHAAGLVKVRGIVTDGLRVIIKIDAL